MHFSSKKVQCEKISSSFNQTISHAGFTFNKENAVFGAIIFKEFQKSIKKIHVNVITCLFASKMFCHAARENMCRTGNIWYMMHTKNLRSRLKIR